MAADLEPFRHSVVRILSSAEDFVGLGLRVADRRVVTCAHVVSQALRCSAFEDARPEGTVRVHAPVSERGSGDLGGATVIEGGWFPKRPSKSVGEPADIALLQLDTPSPPSFFLAPISSAISLSGIQYSLLGAPKGHVEDLVPITGEVGEAKASGLYLLNQHGPGYRIEPGCSGAPVCDIATGQVIGIVAQDELDRSIGVAFLIPAAELWLALSRARL
jgi:hypothetical protein